MTSNGSRKCESDIYRMSYQRISKEKSVSIPLTYGDLERIVLDFQNNETAFAKFLVVANLWRREPDKAAPIEAFRKELHESIRRFVSVECEGAIFPPDPGTAHEDNVLEELLRREGFDVNWG